MANVENLKVLTSKEARANGSKGGKASVKARNKRKKLKEELLLLLETDDTQNKMSLALIKKALDGDIKAFEVIRDTIGEKSTDKMEINQDKPFEVKIEVVK